MVESLAWPLTVLVMSLVFRDPLLSLIRRPLSRLKAGPLEAIWDREIAETEAEIPQRFGRSVDAGSSLDTSQLHAVARRSPTEAIILAFSQVERRLQDITADSDIEGKNLSGSTLARRAAQSGLIPEESARAVEGAAVLRNLAAHGRSSDLDEARALDYLALVEAILFALPR